MRPPPKDNSSPGRDATGRFLRPRTLHQNAPTPTDDGRRVHFKASVNGRFGSLRVTSQKEKG